MFDSLCYICNSLIQYRYKLRLFTERVGQVFRQCGRGFGRAYPEGRFLPGGRAPYL